MVQDQLNLVQIAQEAKKQSRASRWLMVTGILLLGLTFLIFLIIPSSWHFTYRTFAEDSAGWREINDLSGDPIDMQISPKGKVWVQTSDPDVLNRWNGTTWRPYSDFGTGSEQSIQSFALDGEDVWVATDHSVTHFDGHDWENFPDAVHDTPQAMSAGLQGVFIISCNGDLSRYYDGEWTMTNVRDVLPGLESKRTYCTPRLLQTVDGTVWLEWFGIWKFDGDKWQHAHITGAPSTNGVRLVGISQKGIWTSWGSGGLVWSAFDLSNWYVYDPDALGLSKEGRVYQVIDSPRKFIAATNQGLIQFDGKHWEPYTSPKTDNASIFRVATLPYGQLWVAAQSASTPVPTSILYLLLIAIILFIFVFFFALIWVRRIQLRHSIEAREYLQRLMPDLTQPKSRRFTKMIYILWTAFLFAMGISIAVLPHLGITGLVLFGVGLVVTVVGSLILWRKQLNERVSIKRFILYAAPTILLILWFGVLAVGLTLLPRVSGILAIAFFFVWSGVILIVALFPYYYAYKIPLGRGDYATALKRIEQLRRLQPDRINYMFYHASILLLAQQYAESEPLFRECMARIRNNQALLQAGVLNNLSESLIGQGRYDDAVGVLESAVHMWPQFTTAYNGLGELYLEHGDNPARALELIEFAQKHGALNFMSRVLEPFHASMSWGLRAWALAKLNRTDEANQALSTAFRRMKSNFKLAQAALHYMSGRVKQQQGDTMAAQEQFRQSVALDPTGIYGLRAKQILTTDFQP